MGCADCPDHLATLDDRIAFSVRVFLEDVRRAWFKYAHMVVMTEVEPEARSRFARRFDRLGGAGAFLVEAPD